MALLFADENFPLPIVQILRTHGHDIITTQECGLQGKDDPFLFSFASGQKRAVLTLDRFDYVKLHKKHTRHGGIVACTRDDDFAALAQRIHDAIELELNLADRLLRIYKPAKKKKS